jgi:large subunit ribosomal protein L13
MAKKEIERKTHTIDASGKVLGRLASEVAILLQGKHKPTYRPNIDVGDFVNVINISKLKFTGNKLVQKKYFKHSGYPGGYKLESLGDILKKNAALALFRAVKRMLPANRLRAKRIQRLTVDGSKISWRI